MVTLELKTAGRHFRRQFQTAIRGSLIRALTELITNSDDSYQRLGWSDRPGFGDIHILYDRKKRRLAVLDWAEGMDDQDMQRTYPNYGAATSGIYEDQRVRGYFGKGLKDVLFSMNKGIIESIKNDHIYTARFVWKEDVPVIEIENEPVEATQEMRQKLGILQGNGTRVSFTIPERVRLPLHSSLLKYLSNFYMLRLINSSPQRTVLLRTRQSSRNTYENLIRYRFPSGRILQGDSFTIENGREVQASLNLFRADTALTQSGDEREGGILIYDENGTVLDLTLFKYDHEEHAARLYGCLELRGFEALMKANENVLTDTRDGLDRHHPFTQALAEMVESRLRPFVEHERHNRLHSTPDQLSNKQSQRLGASIGRINSLLNNLSQLKWENGNGDSSGINALPEGGIQFRPKRVSLQQGKRTAVQLEIDTSLVPAGTKVVLQAEQKAVSVQPKAFRVQADPGKLVVNQTVLLMGKWEVGKVSIKAYTGDYEAKLLAQVSPGDYPAPENGFAFIPDVLRLANNSSRTARLYVHESVGKAGETIYFSTDNSQLEINLRRTTLERGDFKNGIAEVRIAVKGTGIGETGILRASLPEHNTEISIEVTSRREKSTRGMQLVTGYRFDRTTPSRMRTSYDEETGLIWIYLRNPIVERYFGDLPLEIALNTPHCQILLAEIILERIAWIARQKMIESGTAMYLGNSRTEEDLAAVRWFIAEYGKKVHSWIAEDSRIQRAVQSVAQEISVQGAVHSPPRSSEEDKLLEEPPFEEVATDGFQPEEASPERAPVQEGFFKKIINRVSRLIRKNR